MTATRAGINSRELATAILLGALLIFILAQRELRRSLMSVFKLLMSPKLLLPLVLFAAWMVASVLLANYVRLWSTELLASTAFWFLFVGVLWFIKLGDAGSEDFFKGRLREAVGLAAFLEFFVNLETMWLPWELLLQILIASVVMLDVVARTQEQFKQVARITSGLLVVIGLSMVAYTTKELANDWSTLDLHELVDQLLLPIWLTTSALVPIYAIALYAGYESLVMLARFQNEGRRPTVLAMLGMAAELRGSPADLREFRALRLRGAARAGSFEEARQEVRSFKRERARQQVDRAAARERLEQNAGAQGTDAAGLQLDRREFAETKTALRWLSTCHMGWYQHEDLPDAYREDLLERLGDLASQGLPGRHGIAMRVRGDGQAWYAYRRTPSGYYFGIGAVGVPPNQWFYDGERPPTDFPRRREEAWSPNTAPDRPEWHDEPDV